MRSRLQTALLIGLFVTVCASFFSFESDCREIRKNVLRLHILANSDSAADQALKLRVRDRLLAESGGLFDNAITERQAAEKARQALPALLAQAESEIAACGYSYPVRVSVGNAYFGTRKYDTFTLPAGEYEAVKVVIGEGKGQNWWCVMFPAMCLPAASEAIELDSVLSESELDIVENEPEYEFRFKTLEVFEDLKENFSKLF